MELDIFDILVFDEWEVKHLHNLVMTDYLCSDAGQKEDLRNERLRAKLNLQRSAYKKLMEWLELTKKMIE